MKTLLLLGLSISTVLLAEAFPDVSKMSDRQAIKYFVQNGGGLSRPRNWLYDETEWIDLKPRRDLPASFDLRTKHPTGHLHPVKKQRCGDCWAHSVVTVLENQWALAHPEDPIPSFAQQELISICGNTGGSCNGGFFTAFNYALGRSGPGLPMDRDLPYHGYTTYCDKTVKKEPRGYAWAYVGSRTSTSGATIDQMKEALLQYGTLSVTVHAFNTSGPNVYTSCAAGWTNHMVNIEGWVDDPRYNGGGYWIMRNSWGLTFGDQGYAKVAYKDAIGNKCSSLGLETAVLTRLE
ncbi:MAG: hypothetical protein HYR96_14840 [Deltaproteobacteria bacterium]|nr:hypothetical protein [Deltaproteobacteria bacterium]MBI3293647.1 hypothetical protein [Deltaproteobacteria bacterium]